MEPEPDNPVAKQKGCSPVARFGVELVVDMPAVVAS